MLKFVLFLPFLIVLIAFALSNPDPVRLAMWPTDFSIEVPLSIAILVSSGLFFFLGALFIWMATLPARGRATRAEKRARKLEAALKNTTPIVPGNSVAVTGGRRQVTLTS